MRENRTYGSEGGKAKAFPTPIRAAARTRPGWTVCVLRAWAPAFAGVTLPGVTPSGRDARCVIPAKAGIQRRRANAPRLGRLRPASLGARFRGRDTAGRDAERA